MKKTLIALLSYVPLALSITLHAQTTVSYRVLFGVSDTAPTRWDGTFSGERVGKITATEWKFLAGDNIDGQLFHFSTHPDQRFIGSSGGSGAPIVPQAGPTMCFLFELDSYLIDLTGKSIWHLIGRTYRRTKVAADIQSLGIRATVEVGKACLTLCHSVDRKGSGARPWRRRR